MAMHSPFSTDIPNATNIAPTISKSNKSNVTFSDNNIQSQTLSHLQLNNVGKKSSGFSLNEHLQRTDWNLKAQEGIITYRLPDSLPDGLALQTKLHKLMKTNTIYLNDRRFWTTLENRFKSLRQQNFQQNMERRRQNQQQYEQELISKGIMPYTTEEAIKQYAEQQRIQMTTNKIETTNSNHVKTCLTDYISSNKAFEDNLSNIGEQFESDNIHPHLHEIFPDYKYQTKTGKEMGEKFENDLYKSQIQIKTIFPKTNPRDRIRQELQAVKVSTINSVLFLIIIFI